MGMSATKLSSEIAVSADIHSIPQGYHRTEIGVIPEDWEVYRLDSLGTGSFPSIKAGPFGSSLTKSTYVATGYKVYGQEQVIRGDYLYGDYYISFSKYRELESCAVNSGDILLSLVGTAGKLLVITDNAPAGVINPRLIRFSFDKKRVDSYFFRYLFESNQFQNFLAKFAQGGTMDVLNAGMLKPIKIPLPALSEQQAIAEALSDVDALIESLEKLIAKKRDIKQATMQQLLTGKTRMPGFNGEWENKSIVKVAPLQRGFDLPNSMLIEGSYPVVYSNGVMNYHYKAMIKGPGIVTGRSGTIGKVHYIENDFWPHNTSLWVTSFCGNQPKFIYYLYTYLDFSRFLSGSGVPTLNRNDVHQYVISYPAPDEQTAIAAVLSDMDIEIAILEQRLEKTKQIKQGMMQQLLTGKVRLVSPQKREPPV